MKFKELKTTRDLREVFTHLGNGGWVTWGLRNNFFHLADDKLRDKKGCVNLSATNSLMNGCKTITLCEEVTEPQDCPYCGGDTRHYYTHFSNEYGVECERLGCEFKGPKRKTQREAIKAWNLIQVKKD